MAPAAASVAALAGLLTIAGWGASAAVPDGAPATCAASSGQGPSCAAGAAPAGGGVDDRASLLQMARFNRTPADQPPTLRSTLNATEIRDIRDFWPPVPVKRGRNFDFEERVEVFAEIANLMYFGTPPSSRNSTQGQDIAPRHWPKISRTIVEKEGYKIERCWQDGFERASWGSWQYVPTFCVFKNCAKKKIILGIQGSNTLLDWVADVNYFWFRYFPGDAVYTELFWIFHGAVLNHYQFMITGHSLGGYLAEVLAGMFGLPGIAFNSCGPDHPKQFHSGRRFGLQTPRNFHVIKAEKDPVVLIPKTYHSVAPIWLKGLAPHPMSITLAYLKRVPGFKKMTNQNILDYVSRGQRRRRQGHWMDKTSRWRDGQKACQDSNSCLRQQPRWPARSTCEGSVQHCRSPDMVNCCPLTCYKAGFDMSLAECKLEDWNGQCYNSDVCLQAARDDDTTTCDASVKECDYEGPGFIDMLHCCPVACEKRLNKTHDQAHVQYLMEDAPCKRGTPQNDDDCFKFYVKQQLGENNTYHGIHWENLNCSVQTRWFAEACNSGRQEHLSEMSNEFRCCRSACKQIVKKFGMGRPGRAIAKGFNKSDANKKADVGCPGGLHVEGLGEVELVQTYGDPLHNPDKWLPMADVTDNGTKVKLGQWGRVYFSNLCNKTGMDNTYIAPNLLGKKLSYKVKLGSSFDCGCVVTMYLTEMARNTELGKCSDYYCDPSAGCGESCAAIVIMETSLRGWLTKLQQAGDSKGAWHGFGGGLKALKGPRDWTKEQWNPYNSTCINTTEEMQVSALFPVDRYNPDHLKYIEVKISQGNCIVSTKPITEYSINPTTGEKIEGMKYLSSRLRAGMTPVLSFWASDDARGLDGPGPDGKGGGCDYSNKEKERTCGDGVEYSDFAITDLLPEQISQDPDPSNDDCAEVDPK